ncbi:MAG: Gfo/Idh/MocA family oxidoreductase [Clostridia bacterium]|jgi:myo-inositol 2-dehydrogenase / D-chiro-inositol 1-dehydrogenase|nr:Gfo/Idh/MocA family oxidoreductase [Clostridia bacterium]MBT7123451.1 Gfo/Idh/MocA family oxidoreductase [Clostridia bacterium]
MEKTKVAILGCGFIANIHMESYKRFVPDAQVVAVYGRSEEKAKAFAKEHGIGECYSDLDALLQMCDCEVVDICIPNYAHYEACIKSAKSKKHIIIEKPLALTLEQADEMIEVCKSNERKLMYAEELCFAPKYERVRGLVKCGAVGDIYMLKQAEKHSGPHSRWFYEEDLAGGGVLMDMGCHALAWFRWILGGNPKVISVYASMSTVMHDTKCEDNTVLLVEFENNVLAIAEDSWAKHGGMDDRIEVYGSKGVSYADLFRGNSALTYSLDGYDYAMEKAGSSKGWSFTGYEEAFNQGYPQELAHFIECVRKDLTPKVTGEDGRAVLGMIYAAYESARTGKKVSLPFSAKVSKPIDLWHKEG